jgi:uncharacterized membrane protein
MKILRIIAGIAFVGAGLNHFRSTAFYERIIPPGFPSPHLLVIISGLCEIAGGIGLLIPPLRRAAGIGLIALLLAVFPANLHMALNPDRFADLHIPRWGLWVRLPLQAVFIAWVWYVSLKRPIPETLP